MATAMALAAAARPERLRPTLLHVRARCFAGFLPTRRPELHPRPGRVSQEQMVRVARDEGQTQRPSLALGAWIGVCARTVHTYTGLSRGCVTRGECLTDRRLFDRY